jgi:hypothetical protein
VTTVGFGAMNVIGYSSLWGPMMVLDFGVPLAGPFGMHVRLRASYFEGAVLLATGIGFGF